jgi:hypothetical protein
MIGAGARILTEFMQEPAMRGCAVVMKDSGSARNGAGANH